MNNRLFPPINRSRVTAKQAIASTAYGEVYHIFDGGGGYYTVENGQPKLAAEGGVMRAPEKDGWYIMRSGQWHRIKRDELPAEVRATMLILSLNL